jgi:hypothetical protein
MKLVSCEASEFFVFPPFFPRPNFSATFRPPFFQGPPSKTDFYIFLFKGNLPLRGSIPDMTADSKRFIQLQNW